MIDNFTIIKNLLFTLELFSLGLEKFGVLVINLFFLESVFRAEFCEWVIVLVLVYFQIAHVNLLVIFLFLVVSEAGGYTTLKAVPGIRVAVAGGADVFFWDHLILSGDFGFQECLSSSEALVL